MNVTYDPKEMQRVAAARESFSGRLLTDSQFDEAMSITGIVEREIRNTGLFKDKLSDYAFAFARTQKFDQAKAETIIRDLYKERTGITLNKTREDLLAREQALTPQQKSGAINYAMAVEPMMRDGQKVSFHRASAHQAAEMASALNITETGARRLMGEAFQAQRGEDFYKWGKEVLEEQYYRPQIEAEKQQRRQNRSQQRSLSLSR